MSYALEETLVLVGLMGAGKTAIGTVLADLLGVPFVDSDDEIERAANMSIAEIFERDGEEFFRLKEHQVIDRLLGSSPMVLSTGGGAFVSKENQDMIKEKGTSVWLDADLDLLWLRVKDKKTRPLLLDKNPYQKLKTLYEERLPEYRKADVHVKAASGLSKEGMAKRVISELLESPKARLSKRENDA